ncbi:hypothetical protein NQ117_08585 [Paenibacillus sp. SC116]|uniref:hypothetical protein n=1 Tax=Paenibacillus sp. SC116 TaxID=2968986 RepID=UPI00215A3A53|nr:hypothetical protein [Paenibacillus sp. SC116]MCR8843742.1 hypothetical protein [Paenibacillus sp. SC116]
MNLYTYVANNPLGYIDPSGHRWESYNLKEVEIVLDHAMKLNSSKADEYWATRQYLGKVFEPVFNDRNNNQFKYLYGVLTQTSHSKNSPENAKWAREQLLDAYDDWQIPYLMEVAASFGTIGAMGSIKWKGKVPRQTVISNHGKTIDVTPTSIHTKTTIVPHPSKGTPNSTLDILDKKTGEIKTRRYHGPDGRAIRDVDYTNHGNAKNHPEWPHEHVYKWHDDGSFDR